MRKIFILYVVCLYCITLADYRYLPASVPNHYYESCETSLTTRSTGLLYGYVHTFDACAFQQVDAIVQPVILGINHTSYSGLDDKF